MSEKEDTTQRTGAMSLSSLVQDSLVSVKLPVTPEADSFKKVFHANRGAAKRDLKKEVREYIPAPADFFNLAEYVADVSEAVVTAFSAFRYLAVVAPYEKSKDRLDWNNVIADLERWKESIDKSNTVKYFLSAAGSGRGHIIVPSKSSPGGYDVIWTGLPTSTTSSVKGNGIKLQNNSNGLSSYKTPRLQPDGSFKIAQDEEDLLAETDIGKLGTELAKKLLTALTEGSRGGAQEDVAKIGMLPTRSTYILPMDFDFAGVINELAIGNLEFREIVGASDIMPVLDLKVTPQLLNGIGKFFKLVVQIEPDTCALQNASNALKGRESNQYTAQPNPLRAVVQPNIAFSICATIPSEIAHFITQTPSTEKVSLSSFNIWIAAWSSRYLRVPKSQGGVSIKTMPKYVRKPSSIPKLHEARKALGYSSDPGRINKDNIYVNEVGRLGFCPPASTEASKSVLEYEAVLERMLELSYAAGTPLYSDLVGSTHDCFTLASPEYAHEINAFKEKLHTFGGTLQGHSWDYNVAVTVSVSNPEHLIPIPLTGSTHPEALSLDEYLGMPLNNAIQKLFHQSRHGSNRVDASSAAISSGSKKAHITGTAMFQGIFNLYNHFLKQSLVADMQTLVDKAAKELGIKEIPTTLDASNTMEQILETNNYSSILNHSLKLIREEDKELFILSTFIDEALVNAYGGRGTNMLWYQTRLENSEDVTNNPRYYGPESRLSDFKTVYEFLGGRVFLLALKELMKIPTDKLLESTPSSPKFSDLSRDIMPMVYILGKYSPNSVEIHSQAEVQRESNTRDSSITAGDIHIAGSAEGFQMFPHQVGANQFLSRDLPPKFAVLDIAPGGGKCCIGTTLVPTSTGIYTLEELWKKSDRYVDEDGFRSTSFEVPTLEGMMEVTKTYHTVGKTYVVTLSDGTEIEGLPEHKLYTLVGSIPDFVRLDDLKIGSFLPKSTGTGVFGKKVKLPYDLVPRITKDLAQLMGLLVSDGQIKSMKFYQKEDEILNHYTSLYESVFDDEPKIGTSHSRVTEICALGQPKRILQQLIPSATSETVTIPLCIRQAPEKYQVSFLQGLFEGDGSVYRETAIPRWRIELSTISRELASQVRAMLDNMGIYTTLRYRKRGSWATNGSESQRPKDIFTVYIDRISFKDFAEKVGFISKVKTEKLENLLEHLRVQEEESCQNTNNYVHGCFNKLPGGELVYTLVERLKVIAAGHTYKVAKTRNGSGGRTERYSIMKLVREAGLSTKGIKKSEVQTAHSLNNLRQLVTTLPTGIKEEVFRDEQCLDLFESLKYITSNRWVRVVSVRATNIKKPVYDLHVPGPHHYAMEGVWGHNTALGLADIASLVGRGLCKKPLVLAPNGLVRNWAEDMVKVCGGAWNIIPINTSNYRAWTEDRLTDLIMNAPVNTIVIAGFSLLKLDKYAVVLGNHVETVSGPLEFLKKFGFDYLIVDEVHKCKNPDRHLHKAVKQLTTATCVKYVRLATGTLISNKLTDVVGQSLLFNAQIFLTPQEYESENQEVIPLNGKEVTVWKQDTAVKARQQLSKHSAVISYKRKDWAFMLPTPIEYFIPVEMHMEGIQNGDAHRLMYEALLHEALDSIKKDTTINKLFAGKDADGGDESGDDAEDEDIGIPDELDEVTEAQLEFLLNQYLQRLEQMLTDPLGDPFGEIYFADVDRDKFITNKVKKIVEITEKSFQLSPWNKGGRYKINDIIDYNGLRYVLTGGKLAEGEVLTEDSYKQEYTSITSPDSDNRWKEESYGKVIIFCRYTRSVEAIYRALPAHLKKLAVRFHGKVDLTEETNSSNFKSSKWGSLDQFKMTPYSTTEGVQILIANEQAIAEGHNLQAASVIVRCESPWNPGDLDQASSRIFRPDPSGAFKREIIHLYWIITDATMEVAKMGRLISKMVTKAQFDESDNRLYDVLKNPEYVLPLLTMKPSSYIDPDSGQNVDMNGIMEYVEAYKVLVHLQATEFKHMRQTQPSAMQAITPTLPGKGWGVLNNVPVVPNQAVFDRHKLGLIPLSGYLELDTPTVNKILMDKKRLVGTKVLTELGAGTITNVSRTGNAKTLEVDRKITRVYALLTSGEEYKADPAMFQVIMNTKAPVPKAVPVATQADAVRAKKLDELSFELTDNETRMKDEATKALGLIKEEQDARKASIRKLKEEAKAGKKKPEVSKPKVVSPIADESVSLYPVVYSGYLGIEALGEGVSHLENYGYLPFGEYAHVTVTTAAEFDSVLDYLETIYALTPETIERINVMAEAFEGKTVKTFSPRLVDFSSFKNFYRLSHKPAGVSKKDKKPFIKIYPVVLNSILLLNMDIETNPTITKLIGKKIPGCKSKLTLADSLHIKFFKTKDLLVAHAKQLKSDGIVIDNQAELTSEIKSLKYTQGKTR